MIDGSMNGWMDGWQNKRTDGQWREGLKDLYCCRIISRQSLNNKCLHF